MLDYIKGTLSVVETDRVTIETNHIGYLFLIPLSTYTKLPPIGKDLQLYITTVIREDSHRSYGFLTKQERTFFEKLSDVSGIGPKTALALIGHLDGGELSLAITTGNTALLSKTPGIGKKTAERVVIELRDKLDFSLSPSQSLLANPKDQIARDASNALIRLGYPPLQAQTAIKRVLAEAKAEHTLSSLITAALKTSR